MKKSTKYKNTKHKILNEKINYLIAQIKSYRHNKFLSHSVLCCANINLPLLYSNFLHFCLTFFSVN